MENTVYKMNTDMSKTKVSFIINILDTENKENLHVAKLSGSNDDIEQWEESDISNRFISKQLSYTELEVIQYGNTTMYKYTTLCKSNRQLQIMDINEQYEITDRIELQKLISTLSESDDIIKVSNNTFEFMVNDTLVNISELNDGYDKVIQILFCEKA